MQLKNNQTFACRHSRKTPDLGLDGSCNQRGKVLGFLLRQFESTPLSLKVGKCTLNVYMVSCLHGVMFTCLQVNLDWLSIAV